MIKYDLYINVYNFHYFQLWFLYKSYLRFYTAGKPKGMIRIKTCKPIKQQYLLYHISIFEITLTLSTPLSINKLPKENAV